MEERLKEILSREALSPARFAELVGVQRSSVSHIISGRNKPSLDFLRKILTALEHISPDWLISGKGPYKRVDWVAAQKQSSNRPQSEHPSGRIEFPVTHSALRDEDRAVYQSNKPRFNLSPAKTSPPSIDEKGAESGTEQKKSATASADSIPPSTPPHAPKKVIKTILFYEDKTFQVFYPEE